MTDSSPQNNRSPSLFTVVKSVLASFAGVQSSRQHEADFTSGKPIVFIAVALIATLAFILTVWGVVQLVVSSATGQ